MKKLLLLFAVMLSTVGAWAQVLGTSIDASKVYTLQCRGDHTAFLADNEGVFTGTSSNATNFTFEKGTEDNQYYIKSLITNKYLSYVNNAFSATTEKTTLWQVGTYTHTANVISLAIVGQTDQYLNNAGGTNGLQLKGHGGGPGRDNRCSLWELREATPEIESGKVYRIINKANAGKTISEQPDFLLKAIAKNESDKSQLWYVEGNNAVGYTLRNLNTADYFNYVDANYTHWGTTNTPKKYYIAKAESASGATPAYFYITFNSSAAPETLASAHYAGERIVRWRWADKSGDNYNNVNASLWQFEEVDIDAIATMDKAYETWYASMTSTKQNAQNKLTESGYASTPFALTNENTTCPAAIADNSDGGGVPALLDNNNETFMHTKYDGKGSVGEPHYIQVDLGEDKTTKYISFSYRARHNNHNNNPETIIIKGSVDGQSYEDIQTLTNLPDGLIDYTSNAIGNGKAYRYFRFVVTETTNNAKHEGYVFFSLAKFRLNTVVVNDSYAQKVNVLRKMSNWLDNNNIAVERPADWCLLSGNSFETELKNLLYGCTLREYPFMLTTDVNNPVCYQILSGRQTQNNNPAHYFTLKPQNAGKVKLESTTKNNIYSYWFFMEDPATGMLMVVPFMDEANPLGYTTIADGADKLTNVHSTANFAGYYYEVIDYAGIEGFPYALKPYNANTNVSNHGGTSNFMGFYNGTNDAGTAVKFDKVDNPALEYRALKIAIASANAKCPTGDQVGTRLCAYSTESVDDYNAAITTAGELYNKVPETTAEKLNETITLLNNLYSVLEINQPVDGQFVRLRCADQGNGMKYLQCTQNTDVNRFDMISGDAGKTVNATFCYTNGGLVSYVKPMYIGHGENKSSNNASWNMNPVKVLFQPSGSGALGEYNIKLGARYLYGKNNKSDSGTSDTDILTNPDKGYHWWLEEVNSIPVTITSAEYATFYAPVAVQIPGGVEAYYTAEVDGKYITLTKIEDVIPANTGVILKGEANTYNFNIVADVDAVTGNKLAGTVASAYVTDDAYVLSMQDDVVGMYKAAKNQQSGASWLNNGFKAYLPASVFTADARFLVFDFGGTETAIEGVEGEDGNVKTEIYDLAGRRVQNAQKGVFVVNGKVVIK